MVSKTTKIETLSSQIVFWTKRQCHLTTFLTFHLEDFNLEDFHLGDYNLRDFNLFNMKNRLKMRMEKLGDVYGTVSQD